MFNLLREIYQSPAGSWLGFKGGTLMYFFYNLDRFSVDLDFDLLDPVHKDLVRQTVRQVAGRFGRLRDDSDKRYTVFFLLDYEAGGRNVKIEISKRFDPNNTYEIKNFYGTDIKTIKIEDAFVHKLLAATTRNRIANRDFFDVYFFLKHGFKFNPKIIEAATGKKTREYMFFLMDFIKKNRAGASMLDGLGELVRPEQKIWIKNNLKKELLAQLQFFLDSNFMA